MNTAAAHAGSAERARIGAIAQIQLRRPPLLACQRDGRLRRIGAGKAVAIQAQMQNRPPTDRQVGRHIVRQIDISNLVPERSGGADRNPFPFIGNLTLAVPRLPFHVLVGVIERTAADAVLVVVCPVGVERMILKFRHDSGFVHLRAADPLGVPAAEAVAVARRRRQWAVSIAGKN